MSYLIDTDWIISFLKGRIDAVEIVRQLVDTGIFLSVISYGEVYEGVLTSSVPDLRLAQFNQFVATIDLIAPDVVAARHYGEIRAQLRANGLLIPDNDIWIASIALAHDLTLVSRDQHFTRVPDLKMYQLMA